MGGCHRRQKRALPYMHSSQDRKSSPKSKFWGRISRRRLRGYPGGRPGAKTSVRPSNSLKNEHFGADIHEPKARTSMTPGGLKELRSEKLRAEFSFPIFRILTTLWARYSENHPLENTVCYYYLATALIWTEGDSSRQLRRQGATGCEATRKPSSSRRPSIPEQVVISLLPCKSS